MPRSPLLAGAAGPWMRLTFFLLRISSSPIVGLHALQGGRGDEPRPERTGSAGVTVRRTREARRKSQIPGVQREAVGHTSDSFRAGRRSAAHRRGEPPSKSHHNNSPTIVCFRQVAGRQRHASGQETQNLHKADEGHVDYGDGCEHEKATRATFIIPLWT